MKCKKLWGLVLFLVVALSLSQPTYGGRLIIGSSDLEIGEWGVGETPENLDPNKPILLFVHGLNSNYGIWVEGRGSMKEVAYQSGYQTAFINLHPNKDMWTNGALLAEKIQEIHREYGKQILVISHSKGGIDTQAALIHNKAYPYVSNVVTLGSPHYGSQLADLAYSNWAGWLSRILGQKNEGTECLQTGYMSYYRHMTDNHENHTQNRYFTLAGNSTASIFSPLYWGGLYLRSYGANDGAVVVDHATLPYGTVLKVSNWNHFDIAKGDRTFSVFQPYMEQGHKAFQNASIQRANLKMEEKIYADTLIRGNQISEKGEKEVFLVEKGVERIAIQFMVNEPLTAEELILQSPEGLEINNGWHMEQDTYFFEGAYCYSLEIYKPLAGEWVLKIGMPTLLFEYQEMSHRKKLSDSSRAYLMTVTYDSQANSDLSVQSLKNALRNERSLPKTEDSYFSMGFSSSNLEILSKKLIFTPIEDSSRQSSAWNFEKKSKTSHRGQDLSQPIYEEGILNATFEIKGYTSKGEAFERTIIRSFYVDEKGQIH